LLAEARVTRWYIYLQSKNSNFYTFLRALEYKILVDGMAILVFVRPFDVFYRD
jgi:hypothetical protein